MASTSQVRAWWSGYECAPTKMTRVSFPGEGDREWNLLVADASAPVWEAVAQIMESEPYLFREVAGGTYNCRPPSLHAYGLALDLNPSKNPFSFPLVHEYPQSFIERMEGITANGKPAIKWGGRFPDDNPPDAMHWQIDVAPADCKNVQWDQGQPEEEGMKFIEVKDETGPHVEYWQRIMMALDPPWKPTAFGTWNAHSITELQKLTGPGDNLGPGEAAALHYRLGLLGSGVDPAGAEALAVLARIKAAI